jgi:hypothetical protein
MPDHLQSRTDDMHKGKAGKSRFSPSTVAIISILVVVVAGILLLG